MRRLQPFAPMILAAAAAGAMEALDAAVAAFDAAEPYDGYVSEA